MFEVSQLNDPQRRAVVDGEGRVLILAGAGTGKTRVITQRIQYLLQKGVSPYRILAVTFTRRAANEMNQRIADALPAGEGQRSTQLLPWCGTFHSLGVRFLQRHCRQRFSVIDESDVTALLKSILKENAISKELVTPGELSKIFSFARNTGATLSEAAFKFNPSSDADDLLGTLYEQYQKRKAQGNLRDFDDLLEFWNLALREEVGKGQKYWDYVLVDEYQDTNYLQEQILECLAETTPNLMVVGDDAQSIYSFRGSLVTNIRAFEKKFTPCRVIKLEENYRSNQQVLDLANAVWDEANEGMQKTLSAFKTNTGNKPELIGCDDEKEQAKQIIDSVVDDFYGGMNYCQQAVLFRSAFHAIYLEMELRRRRIPYRKFGGQSIADSAHVKDFQAILRCINSPVDEPAWMRFLTLLPKVGIKTAERIFAITSTNSAEDRFARVPQKQKLLLRDYIPLFEDRDSLFEAVAETTLPEKLDHALALYLPLLKAKYEKADLRAQDLESFIEVAAEYDDLQNFLNDFYLETDERLQTGGELPKEYLTLSTIHSAKGCEWPKVMVMQVIDNALPSRQSLELGNVEEERRLFYVAVTRAEDKLELFYPKALSPKKNQYSKFGEQTTKSCFLSEHVMPFLECDAGEMGNYYDYEPTF